MNLETQAKLIADLKCALSEAVTEQKKGIVLAKLTLAYSYANALDCPDSQHIKLLITEIENIKGRLQVNDLSKIKNFCLNFKHTLDRNSATIL